MSTELTADEQVDISDIGKVNNVSIGSLLDPQVQAELEHLNAATDRIKKLEIELDKARSEFRCLLSESSSKVNILSKKLGSCVEKTKQYREARIHIRQWMTEPESVSNLEHQRMLHNECEKVVHQLHQELKKGIVKSCLSTRRNLLQLNNLANQHQLQLLPYFEMKAQFNQMFEEQIKLVPPFEDNYLKMNDDDRQIEIEKFRDKIHQQWKFQDLLNCGRSNGSKVSNSLTSSYQDSLSSDNVYLEHLFSEDMYMALPSSLKLTPGLVSCSVSHSDNNSFKSSNYQQTDEGSSTEDLSSKTSLESFSRVDLFKNITNGF